MTKTAKPKIALMVVASEEESSSVGVPWTAESMLKPLVFPEETAAKKAELALPESMLASPQM